MASGQLRTNAHADGDVSKEDDVPDSGQSRCENENNKNIESEQNIETENMSPSKTYPRDVFGILRLRETAYTDAKAHLPTTPREDRRGEDPPDTDQGKAHDEGQGFKSDTSMSSAGIPRFGNTATRQEKGEKATMKNELETTIQVIVPRKSSRQSKATAVPKEHAKAIDSEPPRKRVKFGQKKVASSADALHDEPRRSSRTAAASATHQITEQLRRKAAAKPPVTLRSQKKAAPSPDNKGKRRTASVTPDSGSKRKGVGRPKKPEYEVELILDTRKKTKSSPTEYLVKWKGYHVKESTWEPAANLTHCPQALAQFRSPTGKGKQKAS